MMAAMAVVAPAAAMEPARSGCEWVPDLLPLPTDTAGGEVTAGDGKWFAGDGYAPDEGLLWQDGRLVAHEQAFGLETKLKAVNASGVAAGDVYGTDGRSHAVRYAGGRYEYLPETAARSVALDVNDRGTVVGYDGAALVVWPPSGPARVLPMPPGAAPNGKPSIDEDDTVVVRTGTLADRTMRWQTYAWSPSGTRVPLAAGDVRDVRDGWAVGTLGQSVAVAAGWSLGGDRSRAYVGGIDAVAVNRTGVAVGTGTAGEPLLWFGLVPVPLPAPPGYYPGPATAVNDTQAGGFVSPLDDAGTVPVRWFCR
ncbi:hypothetical protein [Actinophytocola sp.]|uniref:hypothetical protein n=1 Tax=Actinophytocola sp. TaxID=1872138 RepID=UPI0038998544